MDKKKELIHLYNKFLKQIDLLEKVLGNLFNVIYYHDMSKRIRYTMDNISIALNLDSKELIVDVNIMDINRLKIVFIITRDKIQSITYGNKKDKSLTPVEIYPTNKLVCKIADRYIKVINPKAKDTSILIMDYEEFIKLQVFFDAIISELLTLDTQLEEYIKDYI